MSETRERALELAKKAHWLFGEEGCGFYDGGRCLDCEAMAEIILEKMQSLEAEVAANSYGAAAQLSAKWRAKVSPTVDVSEYKYIRDEVFLECAMDLDDLTPQASQDFAKRREVEIRCELLESLANSSKCPHCEESLRERAESSRSALAGAAPGEETTK